MARGGSSAATLFTTVRVGGDAVLPSRIEGRLSVYDGLPVPLPAGQFSATLYYMPYKGNHISLFRGGSWRDCTFAQITISNAGLDNLGIYDVYAFADVGDIVTLELSEKWEEWYERSEDIAYLDGVAVKASDHTRRLIGTILTAPGGQFVDSGSARFVSNLYNTVSLPMGTCDGYVDQDVETLVPFSSPDDTWKFYMPNFNIGNYVDWVLCEPRMVALEAAFSLRDIDADALGCAISIGVGPEHDTQTLGDVLGEIRNDSGDATWADSLQFNSLRPIGSCQGYQSFFLKGKSHSMNVIASDAYHGGTSSKPSTFIMGWIDN